MSNYMYIIILILQFNVQSKHVSAEEGKQIKVENKPFHAYSTLQEEMHAFVN